MLENQKFYVNTLGSRSVEVKPQSLVMSPIHHKSYFILLPETKMKIRATKFQVTHVEEEISTIIANFEKWSFADSTCKKQANLFENEFVSV